MKNKNDESIECTVHVAPKYKQYKWRKRTENGLNRKMDFELELKLWKLGEKCKRNKLKRHKSTIRNEMYIAKILCDLVIRMGIGIGKNRIYLKNKIQITVVIDADDDEVRFSFDLCDQHLIYFVFILCHPICIYVVNFYYRPPQNTAYTNYFIHIEHQASGYW